MDRRTLVKSLALSLAMSPLALVSGCSGGGSRRMNFGPLLAADANGVMLPDGFTSRIVARSGQPPYPGSGFVWHDRPDGGATFATLDDGWIYVSNSEVDNSMGGVGALRFDANGEIIDAYSILDNTSRNCAGGATPWGSWLSCEEVPTGAVWECDPSGQTLALRKEALGVFNHEAVAVDLISKTLYLTEDEPDGGFYRYVPSSVSVDGVSDLNAGELQIASLDNAGTSINWIPVPDPSAAVTPTRSQVATSEPFDGGEGIVYYDGDIFFATKGDNKIWRYNILSSLLSVLYDAGKINKPILTGVDNITVSAAGDLLVAEDGGDMQIVAITSDDAIVPVLQLSGHKGSEIAGPAFSPDGSRLYFSSQRGPSNRDDDGITYEITGPFVISK